MKKDLRFMPETTYYSRGKRVTKKAYMRDYTASSEKNMIRKNDKSLAELAKLVDDSTTYITIPTPPGWKCERPKCTTDFKHKHSTYAALKASE